MQARIRALTKRPSILRALAKGTVTDVIAVMDTHADAVIKQLQVYPPPPPGSRYKRTNTYRDSWKQTDVRLTADGLVKSIESDATDPYGRTYSVLVGGDEAGKGQWGVHKQTGWPLIAEVLRAGYDRKIRRAVHEALA